MLLTIQIVNYNSRDNLHACLRSIRENIPEQINLQIIVINNDKEKLEVYSEESRVELIEKNENIGFGKAHNIGSQAAKGKYVLFLNPDTKLFPSAVEKLLSVFSKDEKIGIVGPVHMGENDISEEEYFGWQRTPLSVIRAKIWRKRQPIPNDVFETDWVSGGALMAKKDLFLDLGGFDGNYFMYFEDVDLCLQAKKKGWKIVVHPEAKIFHKSGQSFSCNRKKKKYYYDSQAYYIKKNFGPFWSWFVKILRFPLYVRNVYCKR
ncbi:MAG: hypothetical protein UX02_C0001G0222 [Candidatus Moranbacteria bacterium GW2011_GWC1_45_18]|nr:MAG: hypothetical protein UT79_C0002G0175 [Candidatus Moranbacteria bacterium GW2011_GWC2_40_12]KKT32588.1 MAG: hypothetical protein UW19_C0018G0010 [Candidatus Moranbacteria bacterium GW2011_GWF2_44_10]KKU00774.1 MAG: hypothetical protein UX02_C0001G0222 [Candidatus Moranbacteria bacterium GW2011_GWC1_45_18]OGI24158.1 MAG: hypothetical protein A2194_02460 [Candidatus Moranbacteria bacterium RIFOXYA1_FULL_44_8]OGI34756.1 MAG: hypothetical protein A2407_02250 [Candidatus Moranbacteria bacteri